MEVIKRCTIQPHNYYSTRRNRTKFCSKLIDDDVHLFVLKFKRCRIKSLMTSLKSLFYIKRWRCIKSNGIRLDRKHLISSVFSILDVVAQGMKENRSFNLKLICGSRCDMNLFQYWKLLVFNVPSFLSLLNTRSLCKSHNLRKGRLNLKSMVASFFKQTLY